MITQGMATLVNFGIHLTPGLLLFGAWFALTPRSMTAIRILILLAAFCADARCDDAVAHVGAQ